MTKKRNKRNAAQKRLNAGHDAKVNRKYKDTVFRMLFSDRDNLLSLYNAVSGKDYGDPEQLEIVTLENAIYMGMYNNLAGEPNLELKVLTLNVNEGYNQKLMEQCQILKEYAQYVARVRKYAAEMKLEDAVERAVSECVREEILADFLRKNRSEVIAMSIFEYDKEEEERKLKEAEFEYGVEHGQKLELIKLIMKKVKKGLSVSEIADFLEKDTDFVQAVYDAMTMYPEADIKEIFLKIENNPFFPFYDE